MTYTRLWLATLLAGLLLSGCTTIAQSRWEGRDLQEALNLFGTPDSMQKEIGPNGEPLAVLTGTSPRAGPPPKRLALR